MYIILENGKPREYSILELKRDNPGVSFPENISDKLLEEFNVYPLIDSSKPTFNPDKHRIELGDIVLKDGEWTREYLLHDIPITTIEERCRNTRDNLLKETDWIITKCIETNTHIPKDILEYRQELRDITLQPSFPYTVFWPTKPV